MRAILDALAASPVEEHLRRIEPEPVDLDLLHEVHNSDYVTQVHELARSGGGLLDPDTVVSPDSYEVALLAAGGAVTAVRAVVAKESDAAFAAVRPPGHHALPARGMGFCLFNNIVLAATAARHLGRSRIAIVDWDVHHGNGTQAIFYRTNSVLFISLHQEFWYPGTGAIEETGDGDGVGFTVNVPLSAGVGDEGYRHVFEEIVLPIVGLWSPDLLLISAGYDSHAGDPLGGMRLTARGFRTLTALVRETARCPIVAVLEGGYDLTNLSQAVVATIGVLAGVSLTQEAARVDEIPYATVRARVRAVRTVQRNYWSI